MTSELVHLALGGTISMEIVDGLAVPTLTGAELARRAGIATTPVEVATLPGPQLTYGLLVEASAVIAAAQERGAAGVVVTLGTDAFEEVAAFLAYTGPWRTNVVITGSMDPGGETETDAMDNLRDAAAVAMGPRLIEPVVVFAGRVLLARAVVKVSGTQRDAFTSPNTRAWSVGEVLEAGELPGAGTVPPLLGRPGAESVEVPIVVSALTVSAGAAPAPAPDGLAAEYAGPALVCMASGAGNLAPPAATIALTALANGAVVAIATRALDNRMSAGYGYAGGSGPLAAAGAVLAAGMTAHRARMFLLIALSQGLRGPALAARLSEHVAAL